MAAKREITPKRGIYENVKGSGIWWIRWTDSEGRKRRAEKLEGVKLPDNLRAKSVTFGELCEDRGRRRPSLRCAPETPCRGRADGSLRLSKWRRFLIIRGIATAIRLPVDL